jgi:GNAT superfamily N-acetyltransferase
VIHPRQMEPLLKRIIKDPEYLFYGFEMDGVLAAIATVSFREVLFYEGKMATIEEIIVDNIHRGKGIGKKLVKKVEQLAKKKKVRGIETFSDFHRKRTHTFWEKREYPKLAYQFRKEF